MVSKKVLFADDDIDFRSFMKEAIEEISSEINTKLIVTEAYDGAEAIRLFNESIDNNEPFDIVITDYMMPGASGLQVIKHIMEKNPIPTIVISGYRESEKVDFIMEGAIIFISKPFLFEQMVKAFSEAVSFSMVEEDIKKSEDIIKRLEKLTI